MRNSASKLFQKRIRDLRKSRGWTQEHAAEKCGIGYKLYQLYEIGIKKNPGLLTLEKIARGYEMELHELLNPAESPPRRNSPDNPQKTTRQLPLNSL